ncbi:MAG: hypothetical protein V5A38_09370 [Halolamina sp.]|uniref:hypothetical protein n=1 Tax=Halolamina sp. TaxID=1940283 RepID=UPI002FC397ED
MHRRRFLVAASVALPAVVAGCLETSVGRGPSGTATDPGTDRTDYGGDGTPEQDDLTIDGRLHNETDAIQSFDIIVRDGDGFRITAGEYRVGPNATDRVPAVGRPGATRMFDVTVDGTTTMETLTLDVEPSDDGLDGFVDIAYTEEGSIEIWFTPREEFAETETHTDDVPVLTDYTVSDQAVTPAGERYSDMDTWGLYLASHEAADEYFGEVEADGADAVRTFVDETAFESRERLVYVHAYAPQTCYELVLDGEPHIAEDGDPVVRTELDRTAGEDEACGDAVTPVRILLRLSFDTDGGAASRVDVHVAGTQDTTEVLTLEAQQ